MEATMSLHSRPARLPRPAHAPFQIGVEEELLLVEPDGHQLLPISEVLLDRLDGRMRGQARHELYEASLELVSRVSATAAGAGRARGRGGGRPAPRGPRGRRAADGGRDASGGAARAGGHRPAAPLRG